MDKDDRTGGLLAWQWRGYPAAHRDRGNLLLHALTNPLFLAGSLALLVSPLLGLASAVLGAGAMALVAAVQGRGHRREGNPPKPFRGPGDVAARLVAEQWITFPRFVLSGGYAAAWRALEERGPGQSPVDQTQPPAAQ